ncbi:hypothetical protein ACWDTP_34350 [Mycobacterium sp. NPDC003449]
MVEPTPIRPEDVLPDGEDTTAFGGLSVRKGTIAAFVANAKQLDELGPGHPGRAAVEDQLRALAPGLRAVGLFDLFSPHSAEVAAILADAGADTGATP